jgi:nucleoside 2-deoxyribosyltransferase
MTTPFPAQRPKGFFAYASVPHSIPATIKAAIEAINKSQMSTLLSWETLEIGGKYIVQEICEAIDDCDFFCADITTINPNVMFELGFAIAAR